jgi:penicillin-binding protein 1B
MEIGIDNVVDTLRRAGFESRAHAYPSLLLGAVDMSPFEVAQMYQTIANGGYRAPLNAIREVLDSQGRPLQRNDLHIIQALDQTPVFLTAYLMTKVVELGTARPLSGYFGPDITLAGKTGTTNESRDSWFAGYGEDTLAVTWLGRDDNQPTPLTGSSGAMMVWRDIMQPALVRPLNLVEPESISWSEDISVLFAGTCHNAGRLPYAGGTEPRSELECRPRRARSVFNPFDWFR